ncbi:MAG: hypothetical protein MJ176_05920 [Treponema sp.]|nr:hypothetical protein [Treponema sp.]
MTKISGKDRYHVPSERHHITIIVHDWERLKKDIQNLYIPSSFFFVISSILYGIAGSAFIALWPFVPNFAIDINNDKIFIITISICVCSLICGLTCSFLGYKDKVKNGKNKEDILEWIQTLEETVELYTEQDSALQLKAVSVGSKSSKDCNPQDIIDISKDDAKKNSEKKSNLKNDKKSNIKLLDE